MEADLVADPTTLHAPPVRVTSESVPEGKVIDFLTGEYVNDTPEEYVRQNVERDVVQGFAYPQSDCQPEFRIKVGSSTKRVDIAVFHHGAEHAQENIYVIVECKKPGTNNPRDSIEQCKSYVAACINAQYGIWTNGDDRYVFAKCSGTEVRSRLGCARWGLSVSESSERLDVAPPARKRFSGSRLASPGRAGTSGCLGLAVISHRSPVHEYRAGSLDTNYCHGCIIRVS